MNEKTNAAKSPPLGPPVPVRTGAEGTRLFLVGLMGSGKSHWGKKLGKKLKTGAYDLDYLVETNEEKTIAEIFAEDGEEYFRKSEAKILRWFAQKKSFVLSTGGGTPCFHDNMSWMNKHGLTIWLDEPMDVLVERLRPERSHRPLIKNLEGDQLREFLVAKREERVPFYSQAKYHLTGNITDSNFAKILEQHA
jgi:shikimate kinase